MSIFLNLSLTRAAQPLRWTLALLTLTLLGVASLPAHADRGREMPQNVPKSYSQECAACHLAYPPGLLPAASWQALPAGAHPVRFRIERLALQADQAPAQVVESSTFIVVR